MSAVAPRRMAKGTIVTNKLKPKFPSKIPERTCFPTSVWQSGQAKATEESVFTTMRMEASFMDATP